MNPTIAPQVEEALLAGIEALRNKHDSVAMIAWLRQHLLQQVMPFWEKHAIDPEGGLNTCIEDSGRVTSNDKWLWSQWRAVWVFSRIYNRIDFDPRWLGYAKHVSDYCITHGWDESNRGWSLLLAGDGKPKIGYESTYVDAFAAYGLSEYYRACADPSILALTSKTVDAALLKLTGPRDKVAHFPYPIPPGAKPLGIPMLWSYTLAELPDGLRDERTMRQGRAFAAEILGQHCQPLYNTCHEYVAEDGGAFRSPQGLLVIPGHAIECMWFLLRSSATLRMADSSVLDAVPLILRHLQLGWDHGHKGGLLLAVNCDGTDVTTWRYPTSKLWWPHTEALYATLLCWLYTNDAVYLDWYERLWRFCIANYVEWEHGEWRQKLDRDLLPIRDTVALPVKDPFHLPRSLILQIELLEQLTAQT